MISKISVKMRTVSRVCLWWSSDTACLARLLASSSLHPWEPHCECAKMEGARRVFKVGMSGYDRSTFLNPGMCEQSD